MKNTVLVVEDEHDIRALLEYNLTRDGFSVRAVETGEQALSAVTTMPPDLILLDLMLPGIDGLQVCRKLKSDATTANIPILMLTAKDEESDVVTGLELGADDYVTKPFSPKVVVARARAVLRRLSETAHGEDEVLNFSQLTIHPGRHEVLVDGRLVDLTNSEFRILHHMARRPGWVFSRYQLVDAVHGEKHAVSDRSVDVMIVGLRRKLGDCGNYIETVRGVGYRFRP
ncbi:MAG: response regulator transcription factor [Calditrichaeota bacterium]|nr:response regulator transcription factor [Calditrichota bacterium]MCB9369027.1 response regulator transcription factor [Calditrichota bacterium]